MVWIGGEVKIHGVASNTSRGRSGITIGMTLQTLNSRVRLGEWKVGVVMIKCTFL